MLLSSRCTDFVGLSSGCQVADDTSADSNSSLISRLRDDNARLEKQVRCLCQEVTSLKAVAAGEGAANSHPSHGELNLELIKARQELSRAKEALQGRDLPLSLPLPIPLPFLSLSPPPLPAPFSPDRSLAEPRKPCKVGTSPSPSPSYSPSLSPHPTSSPTHLPLPRPLSLPFPLPHLFSHPLPLPNPSQWR